MTRLARASSSRDVAQMLTYLDSTPSVQLSDEESLWPSGNATQDKVVKAMSQFIRTPTLSGVQI
jgi:hypothetical protein